MLLFLQLVGRTNDQPFAPLKSPPSLCKAACYRVFEQDTAHILESFVSPVQIERITCIQQKIFACRSLTERFDWNFKKGRRLLKRRTGVLECEGYVRDIRKLWHYIHIWPSLITQHTGHHAHALFCKQLHKTNDEWRICAQALFLGTQISLG